MTISNFVIYNANQIFKIYWKSQIITSRFGDKNLFFLLCMRFATLFIFVAICCIFIFFVAL